MIRFPDTRIAPTCRRRHAARSRVATARSMKYCSGVGRVAARRASELTAPAASRSRVPGGHDRVGPEVGERAPQALLALECDELRLAADADCLWKPPVGR